MINIVIYFSTGERKTGGTIKCLIALVGLYIVKDPNRTSDGVVETTDEFFLNISSSPFTTLIRYE